MAKVATVEKVELVKEKLRRLVESDNSRAAELDPSTDFSESEKLKNEWCEYATGLLELRETSAEALPAVMAECIVQRVDHVVDEFRKLAGEVRAARTEAGDYQKTREVILGKARKLVELSYRELLPLYAYLRSNELQPGLNPGERLRTVTLSGVPDRLEGVERTTKQLQKDVIAIASEATKVAATEVFEKNREHHVTREFRWFVALCIAGIVLFVVTVFVIFGDQFFRMFEWRLLEDTSTWQVQLFRRFAALTFAGTLLRICMTKYNQERNLRILYDHRMAVLSQATNFEVAFSGDPERKNALQLELARVVFADPRTGLVESKAGGDINISSALATAQKGLPGTN